MSVLAATLTTMGALVIIFFLDEKIRLNLQDFAAVVIINLGVSLLVALFFCSFPDRQNRIEAEEKNLRFQVRSGSREIYVSLCGYVLKCIVFRYISAVFTVG